MKGIIKTGFLGLTVLVLLVTTLTIGLDVKPAEAADGCPEGSRTFAANTAASGNVYDGAWTNFPEGKLTLRYSSSSGCAWGLISNLGSGANAGLIYGYVWLDRSRDGGQTWEQKLGLYNTGGRSTSTYTGAFNTIGYNAIRACGQTAILLEPFVFPKTGTPHMTPIYCTPWFFPGRLWPGQTLGVTGFDRLASPNNRYILRMQSDGNFVLYSRGVAVWATNKYGSYAVARMQTDGNLVVIKQGNIPIWASGTYRSGSNLEVQNDGNVVIYAPGGVPVWATNTVGR